MMKDIWYHSRNIYVSISPKRIIYDIPLYGDPLLKYAKVAYIGKYGMKVILDQEPILRHSVTSSSNNYHSETVLLDENDKCLQFHQQACHEMK
jgi:hypothetical protein